MLSNAIPWRPSRHECSVVAALVASEGRISLTCRWSSSSPQTKQHRPGLECSLGLWKSKSHLAVVEANGQWGQSAWARRRRDFLTRLLAGTDGVRKGFFSCWLDPCKTEQQQTSWHVMHLEHLATVTGTLRTRRDDQRNVTSARSANIGKDIRSDALGGDLLCQGTGGIKSATRRSMVGGNGRHEGLAEVEAEFPRRQTSDASVVAFILFSPSILAAPSRLSISTSFG